MRAENSETRWTAGQKEPVIDIEGRLQLYKRGQAYVDSPQFQESRLAEFVMLNPHGFDYRDRLERLLEQMGKKDPLRDNVFLAEAKLVADEQLRAEKLAELHKQY